MKTNLLDRDDLVRPRFYFELACSFSLSHSRSAEAALKKYGDHGPIISGCVRDHFPDDVKHHLRNLARCATANLEHAHKARPRGVRHATIRALGRAVSARDGCGYYGPKP